MSARCSASARARVTPGFKRPMKVPPSSPQTEATSLGSSRSGIQTSVPAAGKAKLRGTTPTTSLGEPSIRMERPTTPESAPKRRRQSPSLITTTGAAPGASSPERKVRPRSAPAPNTEKNSAETGRPLSRSGPPRAKGFPPAAVGLRRHPGVGGRGAPVGPQHADRVAEVPPHQPVAPGEGERLQEHAVHPREDRLVGAQAERQGEDGDGGITRRFPERAPGVAEVAPELVGPPDPPGGPGG